MAVTVRAGLGQGRKQNLHLAPTWVAEDRVLVCHPLLSWVQQAGAGAEAEQPRLKQAPQVGMTV